MQLFAVSISVPDIVAIHATPPGRFMRSRVGRQDRSPREVTMGQPHRHWLTLPGLGVPEPLRFDTA